MSIMVKLSIPMLLIFLCLAVAVALVMRNRVEKAKKELKAINSDITSFVYAAAAVPMLLVAALIPMSLLIFLLVWIAAAFPFSYHFNRKYAIWLRAKLKDRERQENLEKLMEMQMKKGPQL